MVYSPSRPFVNSPEPPWEPIKQGGRGEGFITILASAFARHTFLTFFLHAASAFSRLLAVFSNVFDVIFILKI